MSQFSRTVLTAMVLTGTLVAQSETVIHYQGRLTQAGSAAISTAADFSVTLYDAVTGGSPIGLPITHTNVFVVDGIFNLELDFGADPWADNADSWLQISVRYPAGVGNYGTLFPRQKVLPAPRSASTRGLNVTGAVAGTHRVGIGTETPRASLDVVGPGPTDSFGHVAMFENTRAGSRTRPANGIGIKIDNADTNRFNNWITFYDGRDCVTGRIEGFDLENGDFTPPPRVYLDLINAFPPTPNLDFDPGSAGADSRRHLSAADRCRARPSAAGLCLVRRSRGDRFRHSV